MPVIYKMREWIRKAIAMKDIMDSLFPNGRLELNYMHEEGDSDIDFVELVIDHIERANDIYEHCIDMDMYQRLIQNPNAINWLLASEHLNGIHDPWDKYGNYFWSEISNNPNIIHLLEANQDKIDWKLLSFNPAAIHLLEANPDKIYWPWLSINPNAIHLLETNQDKIVWEQLSRNPNAIHLLEANQDKINWRLLSMNPNAIHLLEANQDKISWRLLSGNPNAMHLLEANPNKINWYYLSQNPNAMHLLEANQDKINCLGLSDNPNAIHLIESHIQKQCSREFINAAFCDNRYYPLISYRYLLTNPAIFVLDYDAMQQATKRLHQELMAYVYHPTRVSKWLDKYDHEREYLE